MTTSPRDTAAGGPAHPTADTPAPRAADRPRRRRRRRRGRGSSRASRRQNASPQVTAPGGGNAAGGTTSGPTSALASAAGSSPAVRAKASQTTTPAGPHANASPAAASPAAASPAAASPAAASSAGQASHPTPTRKSRPSTRRGSRQRVPEVPLADLAAQVADTPTVVLTVQTSGIHPKSAHLLAVDALVLDREGGVADHYHRVIAPPGDPGPTHLHGLTPADVRGAAPFSAVLRSLDTLLDGRTLIVHDAPYTWGFLAYEARVAMRAAARAARRTNRQSRRRRPRVGYVPRPVRIVDTLATAHQRGAILSDTRLLTVAAALGVSAPDPRASVERARLPEATTSRALTETLLRVYQSLDATGAALVSRTTAELAADPLGLQRSAVRVEAHAAPPTHDNPGVLSADSPLSLGMEFVVAPEVACDPNDLITTGCAAGLTYSEHLTRATSLVVCNQREQLRGKAMHAQRKGIPLLRDEEFLAACRALPTSATQ